MATDDWGNANLLIAQETQLDTPATIASLSFYVTQTSGQLRLGIYADNGGNPGALLAQTAAFTPGVGWNTRPVLAPAHLAPGTYWLAYLAQRNNLHFRVANSGAARGYGYTFGTLPATFSTTPLAAEVHWSLYATLQPDIGAAAALSEDTSAERVNGGDSQQDRHVFLPLVVQQP
ncbi:MAG: hypothetical protein KDE20_20295 [Caldilineaceae bacterium]|nr:hypothetical protein [Caldilineaceae bacterium]